MERKEQLKRILADWNENITTRNLYDRELPKHPLSQKYIITLTGPRRAGKSSLLQIMARDWNSSHPNSPALYINFEDERLDLSTEELSLLIECHKELYPNIKEDNLAYFFDEIQVVPNWEKFIRRCQDLERAHIAITGSNSKALSTDIATALRGRTLNIVVWPLSFREYYNLKTNRAAYPKSTKAIVAARAFVNEYLTFGGFPDIAFEPDPKRKLLIQQEYYNVMIFKDLVERFKIQQIAALKFFLKRLLSSTARGLSVNKIYNELKSSGHAISKDKLYEFLGHAEDIFFIRRVEQYSKKASFRESGEKKIYPLDWGYLHSILGATDLTKSLESVFFFDCLFRGFNVSYFRGDNECDFIVQVMDEKPSAYQICYSLDEPETKKREVRGLYEASLKLKITTGSIVTAESSGSIKYKDLDIAVIPILNFAR